MTTKRAAIRVGIIGCGRVAQERHLPALAHVPAIRVVAAADIDAASREALATRWDIDHQFSDYRALLDRSDVDAVGVLTPTQSHADIALAALEANKHVMIEKPLALTVAACDQLIERAAGSPRKVLVSFNLRWHRLVRRARAFIRDGGLGPIQAIRSAFTHHRSGGSAPAWHKRLELGGGVSINEAVHHFDLWCYLLDCDVEQVFSFSRPSEHVENETSVTMARLSNDALATGVFTLSSSPNNEVEIYGQRGRLVLCCYRFDGLEFYPSSTYPGDIRDRIDKGARAIMQLPQALPIMQRGGDFQATFVGLWQHLADCVADGVSSDCTLEDGRRALRVALAAMSSAKSGLPVRLEAEDD